MKTRSNRGNNGYIGSINTKSGIVSLNKNYLNEENTFWLRPQNWLQMPAMTAGDQKLAMLVNVNPGPTGSSGTTGSAGFVSFALFGCTYTVNWGDGTTQSYSTGATAQKMYFYSDLSANTELINGSRQVILEAFPSIAGTTFFRMDLGSRFYNQPGITASVVNLISSIKICSDSLRGLTLYNVSFNANGGNGGVLPTLEEFEYVGSSNIKNLTFLFKNAKQLKSVIGTDWTQSCENFTEFMNGALSLKVIPNLNVNSGVTFTSAFQGMRLLEDVKISTFPSAITCNTMFASNPNLKILGTLNFPKARSFTQTFQNCGVLTRIDSIILGATAFTMQNTFQDCNSLQILPQMDLTNCTSVLNMFLQCRSIVNVPNYNLPNVTTLNSMFNNCERLKTIPNLNTINNLDLTQFLSGCNDLIYVPHFDTSKVTNFTNFFLFANNLRTVPILDVSQGTNFTNIFLGCSSLTRGTLKDTNASISYNACSLSPSALDEIFTYLGVTGAGKTITITGNWGASGCNRSIATAKGWAVSG